MRKEKNFFRFNADIIRQNFGEEMALKDTRKFASTADIRQKLNNSIIMYLDIPVVCTCTGESSKIRIRGLSLNKDGYSDFDKEVEYDDVNLIMQSPPLGYVNNSKTTAIYTSRIPLRQFHIGLTANCVEYRNITGSHHPGLSDWPWSIDLKKTFTNDYPSPIEILDRLYKKGNKAWSQAFSRTLAFGFSEENGLRLFHKNTPIAYYKPKENAFFPIKKESTLVENILMKHGIKNYASSF